MQRAEHEVPRERGLDGDLSGLAVANLADHNDVRVLAQDRPQAVGKGEVDPGIHLNLPDAIQLIFDRILDGDDVQFRRVDLVQGTVEGRGFPTAGRPCHQEDPVRAFDQTTVLDIHLLPHTDLFQPEEHAGFVQETEDDALAIGGGDYGDADVDIFLADTDTDAAVLR